MEKKTITMRIEHDLSERLRNAVYWTPGANLSEFIEEAIRELLEKKESLNGGPFKIRKKMRQNRRSIN